MTDYNTTANYFIDLSDMAQDSTVNTVFNI